MGVAVGRLEGQVALVTGAESGIGRATAMCFAAEGASVAGVGLQAALGANLADELESQGLRGQFVVSDVGTYEGAKAAVRSATEAFGALHIVVNCAGIMSFGSVEDCEEAEWDRVIRVNLKSVYLVSRAAIPHLRAAGGGSIINVASTHAIKTTDRVAAYATSKAAVVGLSRQMAIDCAGDGIRVNSAVVGAVDTAMSALHRAYRERGSAGHRGENSGREERVAQPGEIARALLFLASSDGSFVTGSAMVVDGGQLAGFRG
jgi:NAD(P)-dependent dehydrogenase (short-subunit alcohol dehydrogenase family)